MSRDCKHENLELRIRYCHDGVRYHLGEQCVDCGALVGSWIPHRYVDTPRDQLPRWEVPLSIPMYERGDGS